MNKALFLVGLSMCAVLCFNPAFAQDLKEKDAISSVVVKEDYSPQLIEKIKTERNSIYNALNLTPEQINQKNDLEGKRYQELQPKLRQFCLERKKLKDIQAQKSDENTVKMAQNNLNKTKSEIKKISSKYDRDFKKILTSEQKSKYNMIVKLKRADIRELEHKQKETALRPFGVPVTQAEYAQKQKEKHSLKNIFKCPKNKN